MPDDITIQNVQMRFVYTRVTTKSVTLPQYSFVLSTSMYREAPKPSVFLTKFTMKNILMEDITYEGGSSFF